jgi:hypothetical protein
VVLLRSRDNAAFSGRRGISLDPSVHTQIAELLKKFPKAHVRMRVPEGEIVRSFVRIGRRAAG